ncbi:MAG: bifunctional metallophosphatase/5'-nucleotidase [Clostridia bacterium]|nr:bifunctional metallophosphatase/5'-nucleotidase [Clostridia bacterium]
MKKIFLRTAAVLLTLLALLSFGLFVSADGADGDGVTVLFTNDLHSHLLPSVNENGKGEYGGYARLMTLIREQKALDPNAILVDGGDFSMGSLFQTAYATSAIELRMMGAMGFDVTTFGNHEYDYLQSGLKSMLLAAVQSGDPLPSIVCANYLPPQEGQSGYDADMWSALNEYGVKDYVILERGGVYFAVFGIFGFDANDCAPNSGMILEDPITVAEQTVAAATQECRDTYGAEPIVICLSHSGTDDGKGEDYELAKEVAGIDVIISGHTHTKLDKPVRVNDTVIVSAEDYGRYLGVLKLTRDGKFKNYELIPVNETVAEDPAIAAMVEDYKTAVEEDYLSKYGFSFDQVLVNNPYVFDTVGQVYATQHESTLGNLFADAYKTAVEKITGQKVDVALTAAGVIRSTMPLGNVTVSDVFNAASLGVGTEGELISVYITGKDLKNALELDASVQPLMKSAQLFMSGVEYSFNIRRMIFNKVDYAMLRNGDGTLSEIKDDELYHIVAGMYMGQMLGSVKETSFGIISITPRDKDGNPIATEDLVNHVVKDANGNPVKEWYAIASYLNDMGGEMDSRYEKPDGRKVVYASLNPTDLLSNANIFTLLAITIFFVIMVMVLKLAQVIRRHKAKKKNHPSDDSQNESKSVPSKSRSAKKKFAIKKRAPAKKSDGKKSQKPTNRR